MHPEYTPPPVHLAKRPEWSWQDDPKHGRIVHLWVPSLGTWSLQSPWTGVVHEALEQGAPFDDIVQRCVAAREGADPATWRKRVGTYLYQLMVEGFVAFDFPPPPARFRDGSLPVKELGRGGVAVAWLCDNPDLGRVVVKHAWDFFLPLHQTDRLVRSEATVLAELDHPGIVRGLGGFEEDGRYHLVRAFVDGRPIVSARALGADERRDAARQIVSITRHLHERGFLLLDFRPANFYLQDDGRVVLGDVGVCVRGGDDPVKLRRSMGSPGYSAPECRKQRAASRASDAYGLGRLLFALWTGRRPLSGWTVPDLAPHLAGADHADVILGLTAEGPGERMTLDEAERRLAA